MSSPRSAVAKPFSTSRSNPFVVVHESFYGLTYKRLCIASLLGSESGELSLQIRREVHFHAVEGSLGITHV
jgi:hypothetical protein